MREVRGVGPGVDLVPLPDIPVADIARFLNEPRNRRHLPLAADTDLAGASEWARAKDAQWDENGYGPWAIVVDGAVAGWGGFQREDDEVDYALVLLPEFWGRGADLTRGMLRVGFEDLRFASVTILLPGSRSADAVMARWGFTREGEARVGAVPFTRYRLTREAWASRGRHPTHPEV